MEGLKSEAANSLVDAEFEMQQIVILLQLQEHVRGKEQRVDASMKVSCMVRIALSMLELYAPDLVAGEQDAMAELLRVMRDDPRVASVMEEALNAAIDSVMEDGPGGTEEASNAYDAERAAGGAVPMSIGASISFDPGISIADIQDKLKELGLPLLLVPWVTLVYVYVRKVVLRKRNGASWAEAFTNVGAQEVGTLILTLVFTYVSVQMASNAALFESFTLAVQQSTNPGLRNADVDEILRNPPSDLVIEAVDSMRPWTLWEQVFSGGRVDWDNREIRYKMAELSNRTGVLEWDWATQMRDWSRYLRGANASQLPYAAMDEWIGVVRENLAYYRWLRGIRFAMLPVTLGYQALFTERAQAFMAMFVGHSSVSVDDYRDAITKQFNKLEDLDKTTPNGPQRRLTRLGRILVDRAGGKRANRFFLNSAMASLIDFRRQIQDSRNANGNRNPTAKEVQLRPAIDKLARRIERLPAAILPVPGDTDAPYDGHDSIVNRLFALHLANTAA